MPDDGPLRTSLDERLHQGPLRPEVAARVGVHLCRTLAAGPRPPGTRREITPAEIRLEASPEGDVAVTVHPAGDEGPPRSPMYRSPEHATHASAPDARSDVYTLSVILYEALSGELPLPRCATEAELLTVLVTHDPRPLREAAPWLGRGLVEVVERGLAREAAGRWSSPAALGEALAPFIEGSERLTERAIAAVPQVSRALAAPSPAARPRSLAWIPIAAGLALVAATTAWLFLRPSAPPPEPPRVGEPRAEVDPRGPSKRQEARLLIEGKSFFVHLDPRRPGVVVPEHLKKQPQLILQLGRDLAVPIPDLDLGEEGITATLSFNRKPLLCKIPWSAVFALVDEDGKGKAWDKDTPPEVAMETARRKIWPDAGR